MCRHCVQQIHQQDAVAVCADSAKRDAIGQGQAIQRQPLSGVLGKILSRKDAIAMRYAFPKIPSAACMQPYHKALTLSA